MFLFALTAQAAMVDKIAAVVDDEVIVLSDVYDLGGPFIQQRCETSEEACVREAELEVLDSLILRALVEGELIRLGLQVTSEEIDRAIDQIARENGLDDRETLRVEIERSGMGWETYREQLQEQLRQMKFTENIIRPRVSVSEDEVRDLYNRKTSALATLPSVELEALTVAIPADADDAARQLMVDEVVAVAAALNAQERDWQETILELDTGPFKARQGRMGTFEMAELNPALAAPVDATEAGQVSAPVVVGQLIYLLKVVKRSGGGVLPFAEAADGLRSAVYEEKISEEVEQWHQQARRRASVRVLLEVP